MDMKSATWRISDARQDLCSTISDSLDISPLVSRVLVNRGITTPEQADLFLSAKLGDLHNPFLMKDMQKAVGRIVQAVKNKENICIYGDYDVDGVTSTTIMVDFLKSVQARVSYYIPSRISEGYGLTPEAIGKIRQDRVSLIITVDCGVSDYEAVTYAQAEGIDVIVTDHHMIPENPAPAYAVLNPRQPGCEFPFKGLAGVGVAFNVLMALRKALREEGMWQDDSEPNLRQYLDLVAVGTIADIAPMIGENRILVKSGLEVLAEGKRPGISALKTVCGLSSGVVSASMVAYRLAPRLNAPGRIADASLSVQLLLSDDVEAARALAEQIDETNNRRQQVERKILSAAKAQLKEEEVPEAIVLASPEWQPGVVGLCASRLSEEFFRPAILIAVDEGRGEGRGSARSVDGFDIYDAIKRCRENLIAFGGHKGAAGLTVAADRIDGFRSAFNAIVRDDFAGQELTPTLAIDAEIPLNQLSTGVMEEIENLEPFGPANPEPVFSSYDIKFYSSMVVGNGHLKLKIREEGQFYDAIGFNMAARYALQDEKIRLAFVPQFNFFRGERTIQLNLKDIKSM